MKALPIGMYQQGDSPIHGMHAPIKIISFIILAAAVICTESIEGYIILFLLCGALLHFSSLKAAQMLSSVKRMSLFFIIILLMNCCFFSSSEPWFELWIFTPGPEGLMQGINVCARLAVIMFLSNVLTGTTAPLAMTDALERLIQPFSYIGLPSAQIAMILSVAVQFIPVLFEEADTIKKAQTARGAGFDSSRLSERAAAVFSLALPVFLAAFKRADELALAMEARGYRAHKKGRARKKQPVRKNDILAFLICCTALLGAALFW